MNVIAKDEATFLTPGDDLEKVLASEKETRALVERVEAQARRLVTDETTAAGREALRSNAYRVRRSKAPVADAAASLTEDFKRKTKEINGRRDAVIASFDNLYDEVRAPLTRWEEAETKRKEDLEARMSALLPPADLHVASIEQLEQFIATLEAVEIDETWAEREEHARIRRLDTLGIVKAALAKAIDARDRAAELERLRAADEERRRNEAAMAEVMTRLETLRPAAVDNQPSHRIQDEIDRITTIAIDETWLGMQSMAETLKRGALVSLAAALTAAEKAAAEARQIALDLAVMKEREAAEREAAAKIAAAEEAARKAEADAEKTRRVSALALAKAEEEKAAAIERAAAAERDRLAMDAAAREEKRLIAAASQERRAVVREAIVASLRAAGGLDAGAGGRVADALIGGRVPHVTVEF